VRKVIVTGGSRGPGLAIVRRLICEGYAAIAVARKMNDQLASTMEEVERRYILQVLKALNGNKTAVAQVLGFDRRTLYRKLDRMNDANG